MSTSIENARRFLNDERPFRLGELVTESPHPKTQSLSTAIAKSVASGIAMLLSVDEEIAPVAARLCASEEFDKLVRTLKCTLETGHRVFFTGCGATGRLSILLEAAWRDFWQRLRRNDRRLASQLPNWEDRILSVMAGGDYAMIRSVEGFEDFPAFGRHQLAQAGVDPGDTVVAITEGGETPFVIGTAWEGLHRGAEVFFVYNNPTELLRQQVERSRLVIDEERITKLDLTTGPMAIAGSTRMQATTCELLVVGAALETALISALNARLSLQESAGLGIAGHSPDTYPQRFAALLEQLANPATVEVLAELVQLERSVYSRRGLVTYMADAALLDVITDTTERTPTFCLPPFRKCDDLTSPLSWAFVKHPLLSTPDAWNAMFRRPPRGLNWGAADYRELQAPKGLQDSPPKLDNREIHKFQIGNENDPSRHTASDSLLMMIAVGDELRQMVSAQNPIQRHFNEQARRFHHDAVLCVGPQAIASGSKCCLHVCCDLPASPLKLWDHLAIKLVLNTISTATMAAMGRIVGNRMVYVATTNKKLIDRGIRLVAEFTKLSYDDACYALYAAIEDIQRHRDPSQEDVSPVANVIKRAMAEKRLSHTSVPTRPRTSLGSLQVRKEPRL